MHTHKCGICRGDIKCNGEIVNNYDGWPERYCERIPPDVEQDIVCESCEAQGLCECGEAKDCKRVGSRHVDVSYLRERVWCCEPCAQWMAEDEACRLTEQYQAAAGDPRRC